LTCARAQDLAIEALGYRTPYSVAKPAIESSFTAYSTFDQKRAALLKAAEVAFGSRDRAALGNSLDVLAGIPGGMKIARELTIMNRPNQMGALRAARVAGATQADSRFNVVALEQLVRDRNGAIVTDRDIVFRHKKTGSLGRIEVKDAKPLSQKANIGKYKRQIDLMAFEQRRTGQPQAFVNRRPLLPELQRYAAQKGVAAYGNVVTSEAGLKSPRNVSITKVLDDIDQSAIRQFRTRAAMTGFGTVMAAVQVRHAFQQWRDYGIGRASALEASHHTLMAGSGASFAIGGIANTLATQVSASGRAAMILGKVGRYAGPAGYVLMAGAFGLQGYQYWSGELNTRQFVYSASTAGGALAGGFAGAWGGGLAGATIGGAIGLCFGPEAVPLGAAIGGGIGTIGGAIGGAWMAQSVVSLGVESYYSRLDQRQQEQLFAALQEHYRTKAQ
jgi:hypothetical protein